MVGSSQGKSWMDGFAGPARPFGVRRKPRGVPPSRRSAPARCMQSEGGGGSAAIPVSRFWGTVGRRPRAAVFIMQPGGGRRHRRETRHVALFGGAVPPALRRSVKLPFTRFPLADHRTPWSSPVFSSRVLHRFRAADASAAITNAAVEGETVSHPSGTRVRPAVVSRMVGLGAPASSGGGFHRPFLFKAAQLTDAWTWTELFIESSDNRQRHVVAAVLTHETGWSAAA